MYESCDEVWIDGSIYDTLQTQKIRLPFVDSLKISCRVGKRERVEDKVWIPKHMELGFSSSKLGEDKFSAVREDSQIYFVLKNNLLYGGAFGEESIWKYDIDRKKVFNIGIRLASFQGIRRFYSYLIDPMRTNERGALFFDDSSTMYGKRPKIIGQSNRTVKFDAWELNEFLGYLDDEDKRLILELDSTYFRRTSLISNVRDLSDRIIGDKLDMWREFSSRRSDLSMILKMDINGFLLDIEEKND